MQPDLNPGLRLAPWPGLGAEIPSERPEVGPVFLNVASAIGGKLCRDALWAEERCAWMGEWVRPAAGKVRPCHMVFGPDLYLGSSGIALFLARLAAKTGERVLRRTASAAMWRSLDTANQVAPVSRLSLFNGWTGLALAGLAVAEALGEEQLRTPSLALVRDVLSLEREEWDLLSGVSGAIPALLRIHDMYGGGADHSAALSSDLLVQQAIELGDHLLDRAVRSDEGMSWGAVTAGVHHSHAREGGPFGNLTGFSHGASGVGWAMTELFDATGETRFREAASEAFRYERHWYDEARRNWLDLRDPVELGTPNATEPGCMRGWCHGSGGVALARLRAWQVFGDDIYLEEAEIAVDSSRSALKPGPELSQNNYCLCHGRGGNAETLLYGAEVLDRPEWRREAEDVGLQGVEELHAMKLPWPCGTRKNVEVPSLFVGLAGIGYFYLRLANPQAAPSLMIFPPPAGSSEEAS